MLAAKGVVLTRVAADWVKGFSSICTHEGCTLASVSGGTINCPCHGSQFSAATGAVVHGPATLPLPVIPVAATSTGTEGSGMRDWNWRRSLPTLLWLAAAGFAIGALIALA